MREISRTEMLALTPETYLAQGFGDPELTSTFATAAAYQLLQGEVAPQELSFTVAALNELIPLQDGGPAERFEAALSEALALIRRMIGQDNNERLMEWLWDCAEHVERPEDIAALQSHVTAVMQQYALIASFEEPSSEDGEEPSSSSSPS